MQRRGEADTSSRGSAARSSRQRDSRTERRPPPFYSWHFLPCLPTPAARPPPPPPPQPNDGRACRQSPFDAGAGLRWYARTHTPRALSCLLFALMPGRLLLWFYLLWDCLILLVVFCFLRFSILGCFSWCATIAGFALVRASRGHCSC
jgi:hypothetical protein